MTATPSRRPPGDDPAVQFLGALRAALGDMARNADPTSPAAFLEVCGRHGLRMVRAEGVGADGTPATPTHRPSPEPEPTAATGPPRAHALDVDHDTLARSRWRVGRSLGGRTVYAVAGEGPSKQDVLIGGMDTEALGELIVAEHNARLDGSS